jgi:hypothetical protein
MRIKNIAADMIKRRSSPASDATKGMTKLGSLFFFDLFCETSSHAFAEQILGFPLILNESSLSMRLEGIGPLSWLFAKCRTLRNWSCAKKAGTAGPLKLLFDKSRICNCERRDISDVISPVNPADDKFLLHRANNF